MLQIIKYLINFPKYIFYKKIFGEFCIHSHIESLLRIDNPQNIFIKNFVYINKYCWLAANPLTGTSAVLMIKEGVAIGDFAHIYATKEIVIEENVLIANFVYISDNIHCYKDISLPIKNQPIVQKKTVRIGADSWIGEHVSIIGASLGRHCVIGANSVVTKDIPDYCVAVGSPAKVIKRYNIETREWETKA